MNKTQKSIAALATGLALVTGTGTAIALTGPTSSTASLYTEQARAAGLSARQAGQLQDRVDAQLADMKDPAHQVGYDEIRTDDGSVAITLSVPGVNRSENSKCTGKRLCLWAGDNYDHKRVRFYRCGLRDLGRIGFNDRLTSYKNYQTSGTESRFYNWVGHRDFLFSSVAKHKEADLQGTGWNNKVDWVKVC